MPPERSSSSKASGRSISRPDRGRPSGIRSRSAGPERPGRARPLFRANIFRPHGRRPMSCGMTIRTVVGHPWRLSAQSDGRGGDYLKSFRSRDPRDHGQSMRRSVGTAASYGCIRMYNEDVIDLFHRVQVGTRVVALYSLIGQMLPVRGPRSSRQRMAAAAWSRSGNCRCTAPAWPAGSLFPSWIGLTNLFSVVFPAAGQGTGSRVEPIAWPAVLASCG